MAQTWQTVRVFISSTFKDMHAERDHLVTIVFPELRERLERLGLDLYDVDLRWGVPEKRWDGERANSWAYCKRWIDEVEPFFVCILGQRYGWTPEAEEIDDRKDRGEYAGMSITEMEIRHAVLSRRLHKRTFFYFRGTTVPEKTTADICEVFGDPDKQEPLNKLKAEIKKESERPERDYDCLWTGTGFCELDGFGRMVLEDMWSGVLRDERYVSKDAWRQALGRDPDADPLYIDESQPIPEEVWQRIVEHAKPAPRDPLDAEVEQMAAFAASRLRFFQGRSQELRQLRQFVDGDLPPEASRLCVARAVAGQGKSALLAKFAEMLVGSPHLLITHFVGATERSADVRSLLERLVLELDRNGIPRPEEEEAKQDLESLKKRLAARLEEYDGDRPIVLVIDAVNQLTGGHDLAWLPHRLGPNVRIILSCIDDPASLEDSPEARVMSALRGRKPEPLWVDLSPLDEDDVREIIESYLLEYCKELDKKHIDAICRMEQAKNPLYLLVMLHELRTLGGQDMYLIVPGIIRDLPKEHPDTVSLFDWALERLEVFGEEEVRLWCIYLSLGRVGMSGRELSDLLARKLGDGGAITALRIERGIRRYLQRRGAQWDFFHGQLREAVARRYLPEDPTPHHAGIAAYLETRWREPNTHALSELPYHQTQAQMRPELEQTLCELLFIEAKCSAGMTYEMLDDYETAFAASGADDRGSVRDHGFAGTSSMEIMRQYHDFIRKHVQRLILYTGVLHTLVHHEGFHAAQLSAQELSQKGLWKKPWFHTKPTWMPQPSKAGSTAEAVEVITEHMFPQSCATDLATERQMAFFVRRLGEIGMIDLRRGRELPHALLIGDSRPLSLSCSPDGRYLAIAHENGVAELLALHYDQRGLFVSQSKAGEFSYRLTEFEAPVMEFCGQCLWHQSPSGSIGRVDLAQVEAPVSEVALPAALRDSELSGIASTGDRTFVSIRQGSDTQMIALHKDRLVAVERLAATDVACLCTCGPNRFAAGLTSRRLVVFDATDEVVRVGETPLSEIPTCIALKGETLVWISETGRVFTWEYASADSPRRLEGGDRGEFVGAQRLGTAPDGTHTLVTLTTALSFSIVPSSTGRTAQLQQVFPAAGEDTYYAIEKREGRGIWLLDGVVSEEVSIEERSEYDYLFAQDGNHHLFGVRPDGRGILIDLRTHRIRRIASIPANITSVAGSDHEGFWLADGYGSVYFVDVDGACQALAHPLPSVDVVGRCQIHCWSGLLVWSGMCRFDLDTRPLLRFFRSEGGQRDALRRLGQRLFEVADGVFKTLAYDPTRDYLWLLFTGIADFEASMKFGTALDFRDYAEYTRQIMGVDSNIIASQMAADGSGLYILCKTGNLFRVDTRGLRVQATFAGSRPLTHMALRPQPDGSLLLVQGGTQILACRFEEGSMK